MSANTAGATGSNGIPDVGIIDYGMGNLLSIENACRRVGLSSMRVHSGQDVMRSRAVVLPGVGGFGGAMASLRRLDLIGALEDYSSSGGPLLGICLGMQLLFDGSHEMGTHPGLGLIEGWVEPLNPRESPKRDSKIPHVGWATVNPSAIGIMDPYSSLGDAHGVLSTVPYGTYHYFAHSYAAVAVERGASTATTVYGGQEFCSVVQKGSVIGFQGHPEISGRAGARVFQWLATQLGEQELARRV